MIEATEQEKELMRHALGIRHAKSKIYRNHFQAGEWHKDFANWLVMVDKGFANKHNKFSLDFFVVTKLGAKQLGRRLPKL